MASRYIFGSNLKLDSLEGINHCNSNIKKLENIKSIQICDSIFDNEGCRSPTKKKLRRILLDGVASKLMSNLEEFSICGNMHIENVHDTRIISKAIANHSTTLKRIKIRDFIIHATDHEDSEPILESLIIAASSIETLKSLHIQCLAGYKQWNRAYLTSNALIPICQSHKLLGLNLSNLGLEDEHLITIGREMGSRSSLKKNANNNIVLEELILNDNKNTSKGVEAMARLLADNSSLQRLEVYNLHRINNSTCEVILENLKNKNRCIKYFHVNLPHAYQKDINFYLLLNWSECCIGSKFYTESIY